MIGSFYERHILPHVIGCACGSRPIRRQRAKIVPQATGRVLELGIGGGLNLAFYDPAKVESVTGVDPSAELRKVALGAPRPDGLNVTILSGEAESLPFDDATFDTITCSFALSDRHRPRSVKRAGFSSPAGLFCFPSTGFRRMFGLNVGRCDWSRCGCLLRGAAT